PLVPAIVDHDRGDDEEARREQPEPRRRREERSKRDEQPEPEGERPEAPGEHLGAARASGRNGPLRPLARVDGGVERVVQEHPADVKGRGGAAEQDEGAQAERSATAPDDRAGEDVRPDRGQIRNATELEERPDLHDSPRASRTLFVQASSRATASSSERRRCWGGKSPNVYVSTSRCVEPSSPRRRSSSSSLRVLVNGESRSSNTGTWKWTRSSVSAPRVGAAARASGRSTKRTSSPPGARRATTWCRYTSSANAASASSASGVAGAISPALTWIFGTEMPARRRAASASTGGSNSTEAWQASRHTPRWRRSVLSARDRSTRARDAKRSATSPRKTCSSRKGIASRLVSSRQAGSGSRASAIRTPRSRSSQTSAATTRAR